MLRRPVVFQHALSKIQPTAVRAKNDCTCVYSDPKAPRKQRGVLGGGRRTVFGTRVCVNGSACVCVCVRACMLGWLMALTPQITQKQPPTYCRPPLPPPPAAAIEGDTTKRCFGACGDDLVKEMFASMESLGLLSSSLP